MALRLVKKGIKLLSKAHLAKCPSDVQQNGTQEKTPFSSTVFNTFSHGHRVKFLKTFEFGAQRGEGYRGESALLCSQFQTQF